MKYMKIHIFVYVLLRLSKLATSFINESRMFTQYYDFCTNSPKLEPPQPAPDLLTIIPTLSVSFLKIIFDSTVLGFGVFYLSSLVTSQKRLTIEYK